MSALKPITELVVYRDLWVRGVHEEIASLLDKRGMCCLGFGCLAIGVPGRALYSLGEPYELAASLDQGQDIPGLYEWRDGERDQPDLVGDAIELNDSEMDGEDREAGLRALFFDHGIDLRFEDTAPAELRNAYESALPKAVKS